VVNIFSDNNYVLFCCLTRLIFVQIFQRAHLQSFFAVMQCGFACLEAGSVRAKNATNIMMKNVMDMCKFVY
jgi:ammonia channel protein AmtB